MSKKEEIEKHSDSEPVNYQRKQYSPEKLLKGIVFIFTGLLLLTNVLQIVPWNVWNNIFLFWPVLIIILGIYTVFSSHIFLRIVFAFISLTIILWVVGVSIHEVKPDLLNVLPRELLVPIIWWEVIQT